jgi:acyl-CoA dehydrogenase
MDFAFDKGSLELQDRLRGFLDEQIYPAEEPYAATMAEAGDPHFHAPILEELKGKAREAGLWNLFHPDPHWGAGLSNLEYAPLAELLGRSRIASEICNCSAPDTGNMEILSRFGTPSQQTELLEPLLAGTIRSAFAMTEPAVASSDATNIGTRIRRDGDEYVIDGRKWWTSGVMHPECRFLIVMGKTDPEAAPHSQQSQVIVPIDTDGVEIVRSLPVFGFYDPEGHAEVSLEGVRVPVTNLLGAEGEGFAIAQTRLGPGRMHHCMRALGAAERGLDLLCERALNRVTFGRPVAERSNIGDWIAEARVELEMARLLVLKAAWMMDEAGGLDARREIAAIKLAAPAVALRILDRAIQVHGAAGVSNDTPLSGLWAYVRTLRILDGPDEVHKMTLARTELRRFDPSFAR